VRRLFLLFLLALALAACEGTREPELPVVLLAADDGGVSFHLTRALREGSSGALGRWSLAGVQDLAADEKLWVLTDAELRRYATDGFTEDAAPAEGDALEAAWPLPDGCAGGHLALGEREVLVFCAPERVWRLEKDAAPDDEPAALDTADFAGFTPLDLALFPTDSGDRPALAYARASGWHFELLGEGPAFARDLATPERAEPLRLHLAAAEGALWALAGGELWRFDGSTLTKKAVAEEARPEQLTGDLGVAVAYGEGFLMLSGDERYEVAYPLVAAGWLDPDLYLYLATGEYLLVYDAAGLPPQRLRSLSLPGVRALSGFVLR